MKCEFYGKAGGFMWKPKNEAWERVCYPQYVPAVCDCQIHIFKVIGKDDHFIDMQSSCPSAKIRNLLNEIGENVGHMTLPPYSVRCTLENFDEERRQLGNKVYLPTGEVRQFRAGVSLLNLKSIAETGKCIYISGLRRFGKSHIAVGLLQYLFEKNESLNIRAIRVPHSYKQALGLADIFTALARGEDFEKERQRISQLNEADVVLLDEFAGEKKPGGDTHQNGILSFIDNCKKQLIFTSNHSIGDLELINYDPRIPGRLKEMCYELIITEVK